MVTESSYQVRGITWTDYAYRQYEDETAREEMYAQLRAVNANSVTLGNFYHVEPESGEIVSAWKIGDAYLGTKSDEEMVDVMRWFVERGIDVVYKPSYQHFGRSLFQVDLAGEAFLDNYGKVILRDAHMAEEAGATVLVIGTEFGEVTSLYKDKWVAILKNVKNVFSGALTYAANFNLGPAQLGVKGFNSANEWPTIVFDEFLDYVGLDFYVGVPWDSGSKKPFSGVPTYAQYLNALDDVEGNGISYIQYLRQLSENSGKKILITESGIKANPPTGWELDNSRIDLDMQYDGYAAQFDSFMFYLKDVLIGTLGTQEFPSSSYTKFSNLADNYLADFAMLGKPVEELLRDYYSGALVDAGRVISTSPTSSYVFGYSGNDKILVSTGSYNINAGDGVDTVVYDSTALPIAKVSGGWSVNGDTLINVERIQFTDKVVALDIDGISGKAYRLYQAAFARTPDNGGLKYWINTMDTGYSLEAVAGGFIVSDEFKTLYGDNPSNPAFVTKLYNNVLGRAPEQGGFNYWVGLLDDQKISKVSTLINFSESDENQLNVIGVIENGIDLFI